MACQCQGDNVSVDRELLLEFESYLDDHADVRDGDQGEPRPNRAMQLQQQLLKALGCS